MWYSFAVVYGCLAHPYAGRGVLAHLPPAAFIILDGLILHRMEEKSKRDLGVRVEKRGLFYTDVQF
jgi:hypothetical protein